MPFSDDEQIVVTVRPKMTNVVLLVGMLLFFVSLFSVAYCTDKSCRPSYETFVFGWFASLNGGAGIAWLANPLLIVSWILLDKIKKIAWLFSMLAVCFSLSFLSHESILENEAGSNGLIIRIGAGYWLWVASCVVTFLGSVYIRLKGIVRKTI